MPSGPALEEQGGGEGWRQMRLNTMPSPTVAGSGLRWGRSSVWDVGFRFKLELAGFCLYLLGWSCRSSFFVNVVGYVDWFSAINPTLHSWDRPHSWNIVLFIYCWMLFAKILFDIFAPVFTEGCWSVGFYSCHVFLWFWHHFFLKYLVEVTWRVHWAWSCLCGKVFNYKSSCLARYRVPQVISFFLSELC